MTYVRTEKQKEFLRKLRVGKKMPIEAVKKVAEYHRTHPNSGMFKKGQVARGKYKRNGEYTISRWHPDYKFAMNRRGINCDVCGDEEANLKKKLSFDHDHSTDRFRGWLCNRCNTTLGSVNDNKELLVNLAKYLDNSKNKDNFYSGEEAREGLMLGVKKVSQIVGKTMGTYGSNVLIQAFENPGQYPTNDGFSVANSLKLMNPLERMGQSILLESINRSNKKSGDGSSTTCVLTSAIIEEGMKNIDKFSPMEIKRSLEACVPIIEASIKSQTKQITPDEVVAVASISAEDEKIGLRIQEIFETIGKEGICYWDVSKTIDDHHTIGTGLTVMGAKYASPYMCDVDEKTGAFMNGIKWSKPKILLYRQKITNGLELNNIFFKLNQEGKKEIVVFCDEIEFPAINNIVETRIKQGFRAMVVKMPVLWNDEWWLDLAKASGATIIDPIIKEIKLEYLGDFEYITVTKEDTFIDGIKDLSEHIKELNQEESEASLLRASRLNTKTARYFVGGHSDGAIKYRILKVEDAIASASEALEAGVVIGGGMALFNASNQLPEESIGGIILKEALKSPFRWIVKNSGINKLEEEKIGGEIGFNSRTKKIENLIDQGIVDASSVVLNAIKSAVSVASSVLTINTVVLLPREDKPLQ